MSFNNEADEVPGPRTVSHVGRAETCYVRRVEWLDGRLIIEGRMANLVNIVSACCQKSFDRIWRRHEYTGPRQKSTAKVCNRKKITINVDGWLTLMAGLTLMGW